MKHLLLGDEAIALGAIDAGLSGVYAYPGTPSTEITEYIQSAVAAVPVDAAEQEAPPRPSPKREGGVFRSAPIQCRWATNEKTAMEAALGMSYMGKRALVCMKHVGMNVCADAFMNAAITGVNGGLVVVAADDPSMHSSQNEQDSRFYAKFAMIPCFEPSNQQEAYDMTRSAFDYSEQIHKPVLLRVTTRMAHSRAVVETGEVRPQNALSFPEDAKHFILLPAFAKKNYAELVAMQPSLVRHSEESGHNSYVRGSNPKKAIIACGIGYNYLMENGTPSASVLKITEYPLPEGLIRQMIADGAEEVLVIEEGQPVAEAAAVTAVSATLRSKGAVAAVAAGVTPVSGGCAAGEGQLRVEGRLTGALPRIGELHPEDVAQALSLPQPERREADPLVVPRPPAMCMGCGHRDMYTALNEVAREYKQARIFGDIGCYTLGALSPFHAIHACVEMGASVTMAKGAADAGQYPSIAVIGDSTFTHSGMTGLLDCVNSNADVVVLISDNLTTGMTGGQDSAGTGRIEAICKGLGVAEDHVRVVVPLPKNMEAIKTVLREEINYHGVSVVIARRECIQTLKRHHKSIKQ